MVQGINEEMMQVACDDRFQNTFGYEFDLCTVGIPHYHYFHERLIQILQAKYLGLQKVTILEIGAGTGNFLSQLAKSSLTFDYIGVESSPIMFSQLQNKFINASCSTFIRMDGLEFLRENNSKFNVVINSWTFHNWNYQYRAAVIQEVYKALNNKGILLNADKIASNCIATHKQSFDWQINYIKTVFSSRPDIIKDWINHYHEDEMDTILLQEGAYGKVLLKTGFSRYQCVERQFMDTISIAYK